MSYPVSKTDEQWREELSAEEYKVLRKAGTERPFTGEYNDTTTEGVYSCRACGNELFRSDTKFDSHCGWPSFYSPKESDAVELKRDFGLGMARTEVLCARCGSHLGHVFDDVPRTPAIDGQPTAPSDFPQPEGLDDGAQRYCMNSVSLRLEQAE
jgi:peptide-methionine (R)-S-oxide reductase